MQKRSDQGRQMWWTSQVLRPFQFSLIYSSSFSSSTIKNFILGWFSSTDSRNKKNDSEWILNFSSYINTHRTQHFLSAICAPTSGEVNLTHLRVVSMETIHSSFLSHNPIFFFFTISTSSLNIIYTYTDIGSVADCLSHFELSLKQ